MQLVEKFKNYNLFFDIMQNKEPIFWWFELWIPVNYFANGDTLLKDWDFCTEEAAFS